MNQYQLLPLIMASIALIGGMFAGLRLHKYAWATKAKPFAFVLLLLALLFGTALSKWLTVFLASFVGYWTAALISITLLSFTSGVIFALCGDAKKSQTAGQEKD